MILCILFFPVYVSSFAFSLSLLRLLFPHPAPPKLISFKCIPLALALGAVVPQFYVSTYEDKPADLGLKAGLHHLTFSYLPCVLSTDKNVNPRLPPKMEV